MGTWARFYQTDGQGQLASSLVRDAPITERSKAVTFEIGHYYKHTDIENYLSVIGRLPTTAYGETLIAEVWPQYLESFIAVGGDEPATANYEEITKAEWLRLFEPQQEAMVSDEHQDNHPR